MELVQALEDLLWWVQDGLDNADMTHREYSRTVKAKELVLKHIAELPLKGQASHPDCFYNGGCGCDCHRLDVEPRGGQWEP